MTEQSQAVEWKPISVVDTLIYSAAHGNVQGKRVSYRMYDGTVSHVDVPTAEYNAGTVGKLIHEQVQAHKAVMGLQGPPATPSNPTEFVPGSGVGT